MAAHGPATIITGHANAPLCNADRLWLLFYVYATGAEPDKDYVPPQFEAKVKQSVEAHWTLVDQVEKPSGFKAQRWDPKDKDKDHVAICEPTLIYRGSMPVFKDLAVYFRVDVLGIFHYDMIILPDAKSSDVPQGGERHRIGSMRGTPIYETTPPTGGMGGSTSGWKLFGGDTDAAVVRDRIKKAGWEQAVLFDDQRSVEINMVPHRTLGSLFSSTPEYDTPRQGIGVKLLAEVWAGPNGDWANNFRQGWGLQSRLYDDALKWSRQHVKSILAEYKPPRVFFTGHSLGGGLAGAAAERMAFEFRAEKRLHLRGMTFNAAGVNPKTVNFWPTGKEEKAGLAGAPVIDHTVMDEILTTLQSRFNDMPLIGHILRMAGRSLPPAVPAIRYKPGHTPAPAYGDKGVPFGPAGAEHPKLFPLTKEGHNYQTAVPRAQWPGISRLQAVMATSQTPLELAQNLIDDMWATQHQDALDNSGAWNVVGLYQYMAGKYFAPMKEELADVGTLMAWSKQLHLMQTVAQTYYGKV